MEALEKLGTRERAFAVAAVRALGSRAEAVCARRSPELRALAAQLYRAPARLANEATRLGYAVPDGIAEIHSSWYEAPPPSTRGEATAWLSRRAYGHLVDMARVDPDSTEPAHQLERRSGDELERLLIALGRRRVAVAFSGAPRAALAQLCARLGEPAGSELVNEVRRIAQLVLPADVTAAQQALQGTALDDSRHALGLFKQAGVGWLAPALAASGGDRLQRMAQRLQRPLGEALLQAAGGHSVDHAVLAVAVSLAAQAGV
jgi:hypothetical protein